MNEDFLSTFDLKSKKHLVEKETPFFIVCENFDALISQIHVQLSNQGGS